MAVLARLRLSTQIAILVSTTTLTTIVLLTLLALVQLRASVQGEIEARVNASATIAARLLAMPLAADDHTALDHMLETIVQEDALDNVIIFDTRGQVVAEHTLVRHDHHDHAEDDLQDHAEGEADEHEDASFALAVVQSGHQLSRSEGDHIDIAAPISINGQLQWVLISQSSLSHVNDVIGATIPGMLVAGLGVAVLAGLLTIGITRYLAAPLEVLAGAAHAIGRGELKLPPTTQRGVEVDALSHAFGQMIADLGNSQAAVTERQQALEARTRELEQTLAELSESTAMRNQLSELMRHLSSPVLPVLEDILVMPLIGIIDLDRAALMVNSLLTAIEQYRARAVIMDVTGVPVIDAQVAHMLLQMANAAQLLGTQPIVVGIRPELAQTMIGLGVDLSQLTTLTDLQSGIHYALEQLAFTITHDHQR